MKTLPLRLVVQPLLMLLLTALAIGCATSKVDWAGRVGTYTFDQAVLDLGPPDKQAKLTDGTLVAEWLTRRGRDHLYGSAAYFPYYGSAFPTYVDGYSPDSFLRLSFAPDGTLKAWKKLAR